MELLGYEDAPKVYHLTEEQQQWFINMEKALEVNIVIQWGNLSVQNRSDDFDQTRVLRIYDQASSGVAVDTTPWVGEEQIKVYHPDDVKAKINKPRKVYFLLRQNHGIREMNPEKMHAAHDLAELDYGTIWMRWALCNYKRRIEGNPVGFRNTETVLSTIIGPMLEQVTDKAVFEKLFTERKNKAKKAFIDYAEKQGSQRQEALTAQLDEAERKVVQYERHHREQLEHLKHLTKEYAFVMQNAEIPDGRIDREYSELLDHIHMHRIDFDENVGALLMFTDELHMYSPDRKERTPAGTFKIELLIQARDLRMINLTNMRGGRMHPHVPGDGTPCWGDMHSAIANLLQQHELIGIFSLCIDYLESYNPDDSWGRWAANWWIPQKSMQQQWLVDGEWINMEQKEQLEQKMATTTKSDKRTFIDESITAAITDKPVPATVKA